MRQRPLSPAQEGADMNGTHVQPDAASSRGQQAQIVLQFAVTTAVMLLIGAFLPANSQPGISGSSGLVAIRLVSYSLLASTLVLLILHNVRNPIIQREFTGLLRQKRTIVLQCGVAAVLTLLIALRWPSEPHLALSGGRSQEIFRLLCYGLLGAVLLLLPVFPATSIVGEKKQGTLALLLNSPLGGWRIFVGKMTAILGFAAILLMLTIPAVAACYALGGVSFSDVAGVYVILALTCLQCAALGLLISSYAGSSDAAVRWTYGWVLLLSVLSLVPHYFFVGSGGWRGEVVDWLRCASPFAAMMARLGAADVGSRGVASTIDVVGRFMQLSIASTVVCSIWTMSRLNHRLFDQPHSVGLIVEEQGLATRILRRFIFIVDPDRRSGSIGRFVNPVMIKEFRCRRFGRLHWLLRLVAGCAVLSLALSILTTTRTIEWDVATIGGILVLLQVALLVLITPSLAAGLISHERESGGWELLQMTPLQVRRIVSGKLLSVLLTLMLVLCATLPGYLVMVYIEPGQRFQVQRVVMCLLGTAVFAMLGSAAIGSLFRSTAAATAAAYLLLLGVCGVPLLVWLGRDAPFGHDVVEAALTINPIAAAMNVIRLPGFRDYELIPANWWFLGAGSVVGFLTLFWQTRRLTEPQ
jgi:ABC-type transport system involved in multi-copper enzyme maturation permease subunit